MSVEIRYRLRNGSEIVGYSRKMKGSKTLFFSRDQFWWNGTPIAHEQVDESTGLRDINNRPIFEMDIVNYALEDGRERQGAVLWSAKQETFIIKDLVQRDLHIPLEVEGLSLFEPRDLKFHAFLFNHLDLMIELGVRDE